MKSATDRYIAERKSKGEVTVRIPGLAATELDRKFANPVFEGAEVETNISVGGYTKA